MMISSVLLIGISAIRPAAGCRRTERARDASSVCVQTLIYPVYKRYIRWYIRVYKRYISCEIKISCLLIRKYFVISQKTFLIYRAGFFIYRVYKLYTGYIRVYKLGI
jgi:hypothetical protein